MFAFLEDEPRFDYLIRFTGNILMGRVGDAQKPAREWLSPGDRIRTVNDVERTGKRQPVAPVYFCKKAGMKDA